ncbi:MAG TPA: hypothetical protein VGN15_11965 [Ktedonobacteraceae bacterium]|nr:hypothetical protein [Ktedonobacteraceae bacterium]
MIRQKNTNASFIQQRTDTSSDTPCGCPVRPRAHITGYHECVLQDTRTRHPQGVSLLVYDYVPA